MRIISGCPVLVGFERNIDSSAAFQAIATFLANELTEADSAPLTVGGDEVVARAKGSDEQSFRTQAPRHKELNRRENRKRKRGGGEVPTS